MGFFINEYQGFSGNAVDMAGVASQCAQFLQLPGDIDKINERLVRYYVTEGLVDRPKRVGRDAEYGYLHLLQFLASRFLVETGFPMQKVAPYLNGLNERQLESLVINKTKPNMAELLVASFQNMGKASKLQESFNDPKPKVTEMQNSLANTADFQSLTSFAGPIQRSSATSKNTLDNEERLAYLADSIKSSLSALTHQQARATKECVDKVQLEMERMRMDMANERSHWREQTEQERKKLYEILDKQNELIKALMEAQEKGKQNG